MTEQNPYQTPATDISSSKPAATGTELASRWMRLFAAFIDGIILMLFIIPMQFYMGVFDGFPEHMKEPDLMTNLLFGGVGFILYAIINSYTLQRNGQTLGKLICKIKIVRTDFTPATFGRIIFVRYLPMTLVTQIPMIGVFIGGLIDPLLIFRKSKKCLHDNIADTIVVKI